MSTHLIDPATLFRCERLDLCVKYLYARALLENRRVDVFERLYIRHIVHRTNGVEPTDLYGKDSEAHARKTSLEDYAQNYKTLLLSLARNGFDAGYPVPVMADGLIGNGAHRVAAAAALGLPIVAEPLAGHGYGWDFGWFKSRRFGRDDLQRILHAWVLLNATNAVIVTLWSPAEELWSLLRDRCRQVFD